MGQGVQIAGMLLGGLGLFLLAVGMISDGWLVAAVGCRVSEAAVVIGEA